MNEELLQRWRLILGKRAEEEMKRQNNCSLSESQAGMDAALDALYEGPAVSRDKGSPKYGDLAESNPGLAKWLGDIREMFPEDLVTVIQKDAVKRKGLDQLLYEPELLKELEPDIDLIGTLLALKDQIPESSKDAVRLLVQKIVAKIKLELEDDIRRSVSGVRDRSSSSNFQSANNIDWKKTIDKNLKNWNREKQTIIPEKVYFNARRAKTNNWTVLVSLDQSGSMSDSVIYGTVMGSIFASLPALETRVIAFDSSVVDLTESCGDDPVDMLLGVRLGGGTDINKSLEYCSRFIHTPAQTVFILITDLFEGGNEKEMLRRIQTLTESGVKFICLLSLSDNGVPFYNERLARQLAAVGVPCFGCSPQKIPDLIQKALSGRALNS